MQRVFFLAASALILSACASSGGVGSNSGTAKTGGLIGSIGNVLGGNTQGQIAQCFSKGGAEAVIDYPSDWSRRVSRAETEDELLGGGAKTVANDGDLEIESGLAFTYPAAALSPAIEGICELKLDVSRQGKPSNVLAACSDPLFLAEAERAVSAATFKPVRVNGTVARGINASYTVKFCLSDD